MWYCCTFFFHIEIVVDGHKKKIYIHIYLYTYKNNNMKICFTHDNYVRQLRPDNRLRRRTGIWREYTFWMWCNADSRRDSSRRWFRPTCPSSRERRRTAGSTGRSFAVCNRNRAWTCTTNRRYCNRATWNNRNRPGVSAGSSARNRWRTAGSCVCTAISSRPGRTCGPVCRPAVGADKRNPTSADSIPRPPNLWNAKKKKRPRRD